MYFFVNTTNDFARQIPIFIRFVSDKVKELYLQSHNGKLCPETEHSAGFDLKAILDDQVMISPRQRVVIHTGICIQPKNNTVAGFVYSRSGLGSKHGIVVAQGVGVIDPDYTGEIVVPLLNTSEIAYIVKNGDRIAQLIFQPFFVANFSIVQELNSTKRGEGGFGHSGI